MSHINYVFEEHNKTVDENTFIVVPAMSYLKKMMTIVKETSNECGFNVFSFSCYFQQISIINALSFEISLSFSTTNIHIFDELNPLTAHF